MNLIISPLLGFCSSVFGRFLTDQALLFTAKKLLYIALLVTILPIVLKNLITWLFMQVALIALEQIDVDSFSSAILHFSGLSGWLAEKLMLKDCLSIIMSAIVIRFKLNFVPFMK